MPLQLVIRQTIHVPLNNQFLLICVFNLLLTFIVQCHDDEFRCSNGRCIPAQNQCDYFDDCGDGSDEVCVPEGKLFIP